MCGGVPRRANREQVRGGFWVPPGRILDVLERAAEEPMRDRAKNFMVGNLMAEEEILEFFEENKTDEEKESKLDD